MILHGRPLGGGAVLGVVRIAATAGRPQPERSEDVNVGEEFHVDPEGRAYEAPSAFVTGTSTPRRRHSSEPADVILVAANTAAAASVSLGESRVVGIAFEQEVAAGDCAPLPVVANVPGLLRHARSGTLALLDADRGVVILDPSPEHLAHFQAEREHIAPRYRIHLDQRHLIAHTLDLRPVHVVADARHLDEVREGVEEGADEILLPLTAALDAAEEPTMLFDTLCLAGEAAAGKPLIVYGERHPAAISPMMRAAARAQISYALPLAIGKQGFQALRREMAACADDLIAHDLLYLPFSLAATATESDEADESITELNINRVIARLCSQPAQWSERITEWLSDLATLLRPIMVPLIAAVPEEALEIAVQCGAAGLIVPPSRVQPAKMRIRDMGPF
ncbi:MAG: hypothetical protein ACP5VE_03275 [Chthonomonadales bacterium]